MVFVGSLLLTTFLTSMAHADSSSSSDVFLNKQYDATKLQDDTVLQQNPYVVVKVQKPHVYVVEYMGEGYNTENGAFETIWKTKEVNPKTGQNVSINPQLVTTDVEANISLKPPSNEGIDFGMSLPLDNVWATGLGTNTVPIPTWNPMKITAPWSGFNDVPNTDANAQFVADLHQKGIVVGNGPGKFGPNDILTREQFARMLVSAFDIPIPNNPATPFTDLSHDWSKPYIAAAFAQGILSGTGSNTFSPTAPLTREQAASIVWRYLQKRGVQADVNASSFDSTDTDEWAKESVQNIMALGIRTQGVTQAPYRSLDLMKRGNASALIDLALSKLGK